MPADAVPPVVRAGFALMGRYRLLAEYANDLPGAQSWLARDQLRGRSVAVHILTGPRAQLAVDAARRAALVEDRRIVPVISAGSYGAVDYIITAATDGVALADHVPMAPGQARAVVGELAGALEAARGRGVHHLALRPSTIRLPSSGVVSVLGLGFDAELLGTADADPVRAARTDAVDLVAVLYFCLTGLWPGRPGAGGTALRDGQPIPPADLMAGIPGDLDTLCAVTFGPHDDGPHSPGELVAELAPWGEVLLNQLAGTGGSSAPAALTEEDLGAGFGPAQPEESAVPDIFDTRDSAGSKSTSSPRTPAGQQGQGPAPSPPNRPAVPPGVNQPARLSEEIPNTGPQAVRAPGVDAERATGSHSARLPSAKPPLPPPTVVPAPARDAPPAGIPQPHYPGAGRPAVPPPPAANAPVTTAPGSGRAPSSAGAVPPGSGAPPSVGGTRPVRRPISRSQAIARGAGTNSNEPAPVGRGNGPGAGEQPAVGATTGKRVSPRAARRRAGGAPVPRVSAYTATDQQLRDHTHTYQAGYEAIMTSELPIVPPAPFAPMSPVADSPAFASLLAEEDEHPRRPRNKRMTAIVTLLTIVAVVVALGIGLHYRQTISDLFAPPAPAAGAAAAASQPATSADSASGIVDPAHAVGDNDANPPAL